MAAALSPPLSPGMKVDEFTVKRELYASVRSHCTVENEKASVPYWLSGNLEDDRDAWAVRDGLVGSRLRSFAPVARPALPETPSCLYQHLGYLDSHFKQWLKEHPDAAVGEKLYLADQLLNGIRACTVRTFHGDLKPTTSWSIPGLVRIVDFGSCHCRGMEQTPHIP